MKMIATISNYVTKAIKARLIKTALKERHITGICEIQSDTTLFAAYRSGKLWIDGELVRFPKPDKEFIISMTDRDRDYMFDEVIRMLADLDWAHCAINFLGGTRAKPCDVVELAYARLRSKLAKESEMR